jgi:hypothetical protein
MRDQRTGLDVRGLQEAQHRHDELAHRDVLALSTQRRVTHFTLHFAKYAGALVTAARTGSGTSTARIVTDSFIIALACANSLGIDLERSVDVDGACREEDFLDLSLRYTERVGEMAKACEAFDHAHERYPSFDVLERAVGRLTGIILLCAANQGVSLEHTVGERWDSIEGKAQAAAEKAGEARPPTVSVAA